MAGSDSVQKPIAWSAPDFTLSTYDLVFLPGGHDKGVRQLIDSDSLHQHIVAYFASCEKPSRKSIAAICHGVQALSVAKKADGKSVLHDVTTTALEGWMEGTAFLGTRLFLGDYYKTYGTHADSVETAVGFCRFAD